MRPNRETAAVQRPQDNSRYTYASIPASRMFRPTTVNIVFFWSLFGGAVRYGTVRYGTVRCGAVRYGAVRCGAVRCGAVRCGAVRCGAAWRDRGRFTIQLFSQPDCSCLCVQCNFPLSFGLASKARNPAHGPLRVQVLLRFRFSPTPPKIQRDEPFSRFSKPSQTDFSPENIYFVHL